MKQNYRQWAVLAAIILFCTVFVFILPVFAVEQNEKEKESELNWELLPDADGSYRLVITGSGKSEIPSGFVENTPKLKEEFSSGTIHTIEIGKGIHRIGDSAFYNLQSLEYLRFTEDNELELIGGAAFAKCANLAVAELDKCHNLKRIENNTIPNNGLSGAFACTGLTSIQLPKNMEYIGIYGFYDCNHLVEVNLSDIRQIGGMCFFHCDRLEKVTLNQIEILGGSTFSGCSQIKEVYLSNIGEVGDSAFLNCINLKKLTIENAEYLALRSFKNCTSLTDIQITGISKLGGEVFKDALKEIDELHYTQEMFPGLQAAGGYSFSGTGIKKLVIGEQMPLENYLFANSPELKNVLLKTNWNVTQQEIFSGTTSRFDTTIADNIDLFYGENLKTIAPYTSNLYFTGPNYLTITGIDGGNGLAEPLNDLNGEYYVDEHGVLYFLNDDATASLVYCPPGLIEYHSLSEIYTEDKTSSWQVTSFQENAFLLAKDLKNFNGESFGSQGEIPEGGETEDSFQEYELPDKGTATRDVLSYSIKEKEQTIQNVMQINTSADSSYRTQSAVGDSFDYYTGEYNDTVVTVSPGDASGIENYLLRIYLVCSADGLKFDISTGDDEEFFYIDGNRFVRKNMGNGTYYIDLPVLTGASTIGFPLNFRYPSSDSGGGVVYIWGRILEKDHAEAESKAFEAGTMRICPESNENYHKLTWCTRPDEFAVNNIAVSKPRIKPADGIAVVSDVDFQIGAVRTNENTQLQNIGKDHVTEYLYIDTVTLPEGIVWRPGIVDAIKEGRWSINDNYVKVSVEEKGLIKELSLLAYSLPEELSEKLKIVMKDIGVPENNKLECNWSVRNLCVTEEGKVTEAEIPVINIGLGDEALQADFDILENDSSVLINNHVTMQPVYSYQKAALVSEAAADAKVEVSLGQVSISKTHDRADTVYWGENIGYTIKITNESVLEASGFQLLEDHLNSYQYISADNLQKMFQKDTEQKMTVEITNATLYMQPEQKEGLIAVDGKTAIKLSAQNTGAGVEAHYRGLYEALDEEKMLSKGTAAITLQWSNGSLVMNVSDNKGSAEDTLDKSYIIGENGDYPSIEAALNGIGYVPLDYGNNRYHVYWDCSDISLEPGESVEYSFYATAKDSFMLLSRDRIGKNDVITSASRICINEAILIDRNGKQIASASTSKQANREIEFSQTAACDGKMLSNDFNVKDGQIIDYTTSFKHLGKGKYRILPVVAHMNGANVLIARQSDNPAAASDWGADLPLEVINGEKFYVFNKEGIYRQVKLGAYQAAEVVVKKTAAGIETFIRWYFVNTPMRSYTMNVHYQAYVSKAYAGIAGSVFTVNNEAWLNDHQSHRLYASINGDGSVISADKYIVTAKGERLKHLELEKNISEVNYELRLKNDGTAEASVNGKDLYDALPQTYGSFVWGEDPHRIQISYSENAVIHNPDSWSVKKEAPASDAVTEGQYYICWNERFEAFIPANETLVITVTLHYPTDEARDIYASACNGRMLYNNFYIYHMSAQVSHGLKGFNSAKLQKGVYDIATMPYQPKSKSYRQMPYISTGTKQFYGNLSARGCIVTYYVTLYNDGTNRLYLNPVMDNLPAGFRLLDLAISSKIENRAGCLGRYSYLRTTNGSKISCVTEKWSDQQDKPLVMIDSEDVRYLKTEVTATVLTEDERNFDLKFTFAGGDLEDGEHYDPKRERYYLLPGEAIRFGYCVDTNSAQMTEDRAVNTMMMPFLDYTRSGLNISTVESIPENAKNIPINDGDSQCVSDLNALFYGFVRDDDDNSDQWLASQVTITRGEILPGIRKTAVQRSAKINEPVVWELTAYNDGNYPINNYVITDEMEAPYKFIGEVFYEIYTLKGMEQPIVIGGLKKDAPLFTILSNEYDQGGQIIIKDSIGTRIVLNKENNYTAVFNCAYTNWYNQSYLTEQGNYRPKIKVSFGQKENGNQTLSILFEDLLWGIPEKGYAKLQLKTVNESGIYYNKVFHNMSWLTPLGTIKNFLPNPIHGNYTVVELNGEKFPSVHSNGIVNVSSGFSTMSEKRVTETGMNHTANVTTSTSEINYIILQNKESIFRYELEVQAPDEQPMSKFVLIDNLPQEGDYGTFGITAKRQSEFTVEFAKDPKIQVTIQNGDDEPVILANDEYEIGYSTKTVSKSGNTEIVFDDKDWDGTSVWEKDLTKFIDEKTGNNLARSVRLVIDDINLLKKDAVIVLSFDAVITDQNALAGETAWNSFGYHYEIQQGGDKVIALEAAPLPVGIKFPDVPKIQKELQDTKGNSFETEKNVTFSYVLYKGNKHLELQDKSIDEIQKEFYQNGITEFFIQDVTVPKRQNCSEIVRLIPEKWYCFENDQWIVKESDWEWEENVQYTMTEWMPECTKYQFCMINHSPAPCYTFTHQIVNSPLLTVVNSKIPEDYVLPESGGIGSEKLIVAGMVMIYLSVRIKRIRKWR